MNNFIQKLIPIEELKETVTRFPLSIICGIALFILLFCGNHDILDNDDEFIGKICAILGCGYFLFGIAQLLADRHNWSLLRQMAWAIPVMAGIAALTFTTGAWAMPLMFIMPALLLLIMVAPYLTGGDDLSFWFFNRQLWFGVIVSYAALILFAGGLSLALVAIDTLFGVDIDHKLYVDIWLFASLVIGPVYALSWVPKRFDFTENDCNDPPGLKFIVNWISVPMVFVYLLILYAYFLKIVMEGALPSGHLAIMISGFVGAGVVTYLVSWPLRERGSLQLKLFHKIFFPALIIPVGFHFFAIIERVSAYGITEQRYMLLLSAMWFGFLAIAFTMAKGRAPIKAIPLTLAILFIFASFGPWGGVSISGLSQYSRLKSLLTEYNALQDGKIVKVTKADDITFEDRKSISSIIDYLCGSERDYMIKNWFSLDEKEEWNCSSYNLMFKIGIKPTDYRLSYSPDDYFSFHTYSYEAKEKGIDIKGYDHLGLVIDLYMIKKEKLWGRPIKLNVDDNSIIELALDQDNNIYARYKGKIILEYSLTEFVEEYKEFNSLKTYPVIDVENESIMARIIVLQFNGVNEKDKVRLNDINFNIAFTLKE